MVGNIINACSSPSDWLSSWQVLSALGILVSWFVVSLAYMVGSFLDNIGLMARAKSEVWEIITTTLILGSVIVIVTGACTFPASYMNPQAKGNLFDTATNYLLWVRNNTMAVLGDLMVMNSAISMLLSVMMGFTIFGIGVSGQPFAGLQPLMNIMNLFINGAMICLIATVAQITILKFIEAGAFNILLPAGIVCRSFPFTRQFGGSLIAIAIGLFIFYPLMLVIDDAAVGTKSINPAVTGINYGIINTIKSHIVSLGPNLLFGPIGIFRTLLDIIIIYFVEEPIVGLGVVGLSAFILPAINAVVFVAVVRELSKVLGQEVDVTSLSRVI